MIEMELKVIIQDKNIIMNKLIQLGCNLSSPVLQIDTIFTKRHKNTSPNQPIFRIRTCNNNSVLTLKIYENDLCTASEYETTIEDSEIMHNILLSLGFTPIVKIQKSRINTLYKGYTISIDDVYGLGYFLEIEKNESSNENKHIVYSNIIDILKELDINEENIIKEKYYELILKK